MGRLLLDTQLDVEAADTGGETSLLWTAKNGHEKTMQLLLEKGAHIEAKDTQGLTALIWAAKSGQRRQCSCC